MRLLLLLISSLLTFQALTAAERSEQVYPLWDGRETVAEYARRANLAPAKTLELGNGEILELALIPAGTFQMGSPVHEKPAVGQALAVVSGGVLAVALLTVFVRALKQRRRPQFSLAFMLLMTFVAAPGVWGFVRWNEALKHPDDFPDEHPAHAVTLTRPFYMGKCTVTQEQCQAIGYVIRSSFRGKNFPVDSSSWEDATAFCKKLSEQTHLRVRLPTEAEWEYACRAGTSSDYFSGDAESDLLRVSWCTTNSSNTTHPVGQKEPNHFGLFDMHGNVWQWCEDWYAQDYYEKSPPENPPGPAKGARRVLRGGSSFTFPHLCRSARRYGTTPGDHAYYMGVRVVVEP